jgi:hypothetical protein
MITSLAATGDITSPDLDDAIANAERALLIHQRTDGHYVFELEADATIPAEYVMLGHYLGDIDTALPAPHSKRRWRLAALLSWRLQCEHDREGLSRAQTHR